MRLMGNNENKINPTIFAYENSRRRERERYKKYSKSNYGWKLPKPWEGNGHPDHEAPKAPNMLNPKWATLRNIIKLSKDKERVLEEARGKRERLHIRELS